jgi:hypothetical protein
MKEALNEGRTDVLGRVYSVEQRRSYDMKPRQCFTQHHNKRLTIVTSETQPS